MLQGKAVKPSKSIAGSMGHEYEPKQPHGPRVRGKHPLFHSHSAKPKRHHKGGRKR